MAVIIRDPASASRDRYDLIVLGGGIYGAMILLEAARRNLRGLLLERDDFGGHTSFNSLRIIHGGLRYLQNLDLKRFRESVAERQWFLRTFPALVEPLPCLMPLYGDGLRRPAVLRAALGVNDLLSRRHNGASGSRLPAGVILPAQETRRRFPGVDPGGLQGSALWYDACMPDSQRVLMETLRWACGRGARALNYVEATGLLTWNGRVRGVRAYDRETRATREYRADMIINAAGPWSRELGKRFASDQPLLFQPSLAWNVLLDRPAPAGHALALTPRRPGAHTCFLLPWKGKLLAGTGHAPWQETGRPPQPSPEQMREFLAGLNAAAPGLDFAPEEIKHVFAGLLPASRPGTAFLATREVLVDHGRAGGAAGLFSISGVKFTTARLVAQKTLSRIFPGAPAGIWKEKIGESRRGIFLSGAMRTEVEAGMNGLRPLIAEESVRNRDDLLFRRTDLWLHPGGDKLPNLEFPFPGHSGGVEPA